MPLAAGAGLAWLMAHSLGERLQRLAHTNQDWAMAERTRLKTERKQAETALQQSESLNQTILKAIPDLIVRMDRQGNYLEIKLTDAFPLAINAQDVGKNILDLLPEAVAQERLTAVQNALETQVMCRYESPFGVEGQWLWQEVRIVPIGSDQAVVIIRDMTQRHQTEAALRQSEARFRALAETVKEGFFVFETGSSQYSYINPALTKLTGTPLSPSADEPLHTRGMSHWLKNIHPEDRDRIEARLQDERQGENFDEEYRFIHADGHQLWLRSKAFPLQDETGEYGTHCGYRRRYHRSQTPGAIPERG
ncbi:MAG: PAS domain S-box protein [Leptolyngbyaceae cyanobacterium SM2_3_12]|nr:PAS domain S-box protein [Leptolyngbyaceae cyanobacterium SM2_3_12]